jgi:UDP-glucose:(heptosyl)LPS alpha-1,3-glucosyltransferase
MDIALCYESVLPARGGCEMYIADLARRLAIDGHQVHLYACRWDGSALPSSINYHRIPRPRGPRFLRPWLFSSSCTKMVRESSHDVSVGFNKTWGQDVLYPQGGLHVATADYNLLKHPGAWMKGLDWLAKRVDPAYWSFAMLERFQYRRAARPIIVVNSEMVRRHFHRYYGIHGADVFVIPNAIDPNRFRENDRPRRRLEWRQQWRIAAEDVVGLFVAMNYRLKGLDPLLNAIKRLPADKSFKLLVVGDPDTRGYQRLAKRLGVAERIRFAGYYADTSNCYFASDFLIHPTFYDPCSLVVLEALACGLPVITSRYNGASELLSPPREGYVVDDPYDASELARCIGELLNRRIRLACAQAARKRASEWTFEHHYRNLLQVFTEAAGRRAAA